MADVTRRLLSPMIACASVCALALGLVVVGAGGASAHARLVSIDPVDGATLPMPPTDVTLVFDEPVAKGLTVITVRTSTGANVTQGQPQRHGAEVVQPLEAGLPAGKYTIAWKAVSDDGHPVSGTARFTTADSGGQEVPSQAPTAEPTTPPGAGSTHTSAGGSAMPSATTGAGSGPSPSPSPASSASSGGSSGVVWAVVVVLLVLGAGGWFVASRRRGPRAPAPHPGERSGKDPSGSGGDPSDDPSAGPSDSPDEGPFV